ncbi:zinc-ribbon domain-containing protein [Singulisphaera rosea]
MVKGVKVDVEALTPHNRYDRPDFVESGSYVDKPFVCKSCGSSQIWSAMQQKWWYEVAKGDVFSTARLCRPCRQRERARRDESLIMGGDPNHYKDPKRLLAKLRSDIEPEILLARYAFVHRSKPVGPVYFLDYSRSDSLLTLSWHKYYRELVAELWLEDTDELRVIAKSDFSEIRSRLDIEARMPEFVATVRSFLASQGEGQAGDVGSL